MLTSGLPEDWPLRMRVRRSAMGSVMLIWLVLQWFQLLPAGLAEARNIAAHGCFAQLGTAQTELSIVTARAARDCAALALPALARVARQRLQRGDCGLALRRRARRLANRFLQLRAPGCIAFHQLGALVLAIDHRCLGHTCRSTCGRGS